ncbi:MAG TPA: divergent polysaccharide deacetylase family protein [Candidatus Omnitrophota bacterium]|nr:divergent polysaccharide deacetylase family protein [Candidatus Omnitrophota bacterium]HRZ15506.1 divergent polysaccharide deacetylase family protein [Candidatus Omnitrophota bacterium]
MRDTFKGAFLLLFFVVVIGSWMMFLSRKPPAKVPGRKKPAVTRPAPRVRKLPPQQAQGTIAIVLDDWGNNLKNLGVVERIKYPLTISVLPNLPYSRQVAEQLHARGFEIMLHLPMQPQGKVGVEEDTITTSMDKQTIQDIVQKDLEQVPFAQGSNNHMGSKATSDWNTMRVVLKTLGKHRFYFVDSFSSPDSVAADAAAESGVRFIRRDIFIDNKNDKDYIRQQLFKLKKRAQENGYALGIGHDRTLTLEVLAEVLPALEQEGFRFVPVSTLIDESGGRYD